MTSHVGTPSPLILVTAAVLVGLEALALFSIGVTVVLGGDSSRMMLDVSTAAFFALYTAGLLVCGWGLARVSRWARGPTVLAQLIQLGVAWSFFSGETQPVAVALAAVAVVVMSCVLSPPATRALIVDQPAGH
ncbi:MAG: hypothetical protein ACRDOY_05530 [Nocardioidaceae bacterium]